jgi:hypothetical protein
MWTMTPTGFTSAVVHRDDPSLLMVRARDRESLLALVRDLGRSEGDVYSSLPSDYPYRVVVSKTEYADWLRDQALGIAYTNFKGEAARRRGDAFVAFLHEVWASGLSLTDTSTRGRNEAAWNERERH